MVQQSLKQTFSCRADNDEVSICWSLISPRGSVIKFPTSIMKVFSSWQGSSKLKGDNPQASFNKDLEEFYDDLEKGLNNLANSLSENFVSLGWVKEAINLLKSMHCNVIRLVRTEDCPILFSSEEGWMNSYMDESVKLLDMCNALKAGISELRHYQMLVDFALSKLDNLQNDDAPFSCRLGQILDACMENATRLGAQKRRILFSRNLADEKNFAFSLNEKPLKSKSILRNGLWGVMVAVKILTTLISWLLISSIIYPVPLKLCSSTGCVPVPPKLSRALNQLCVQFNDRIGSQENVNKGAGSLLSELDALSAITTDLRERVGIVSVDYEDPDSGIILESREEFEKGVQLLKQKSSDFKEDLASVNGLVMSLFDEIVHSRDQLLHIMLEKANVSKVV